MSKHLTHSSLQGNKSCLPGGIPAKAWRSHVPGAAICFSQESKWSQQMTSLPKLENSHCSLQQLGPNALQPSLTPVFLWHASDPPASSPMPPGELT